MFSGILLTTDAAAANPYGGVIMVVYIILIVAFVYFFMIRPQKTEQKKKNAMLGSLEVGDSVLTTAGFYGVVIDIADDTVIVEFGNNKNCRIPMQKSAIVQIEKAGSAVEESSK
ncbi:MAG: preprotein translocase subunit YajC [Lachnospiraceae bacterium]|nr:preprotein translocase subunit YajC [Lachnospiraceae bacterium]